MVLLLTTFKLCKVRDTTWLRDYYSTCVIQTMLNDFLNSVTNPKNRKFFKEEISFMKTCVHLPSFNITYNVSDDHNM